MKQFITRRSFIKAAGAATALTAVSVGAPAAFAEETNCFFGDKADVTILYTNDVHTYIDNKSPKPTYAAIAALKKSIEDTGRDVLLVDAGDHIQGTAYGSMDDGATIIELMNEAGYDIATLGNHEFDYGMARAKAIIKEADFPYVSCNWVDLRTGLRVLPAVKLFPAGGKWIAFVGITTPESFTKSTPAYFMNAKQTKYIYDILGGDDGRKLYDAVQKAIDKAKTLGADIIIGLGHLGVDPSSSPWTSEEVIANTTGFDAFIDGHSHTVMENKQVYDAAGKAVTLTQTGSYFANVGEMTIAADGTISALTPGDPPNTVSPVGKLKVVKANATEVARGDDGLFHLTPSAIATRGQTLQADPTLRLQSGVLEGSNVKPVEAMTDMIANSRRFEMQMKVISNVDDNEQRANQLLSMTS